MAKVSVIVPIYNGDKYIENNIQSMINQTLEDIEIIYINDCSTDNSLSILQEYAKKDPRIKVINSEKNQGQSKSKNICIELAQSDYLMFCDQDDWYEPDACELCYNQITKNNNDLVMFDFNYVFENGKIKPERKRIEALKEYIDCPNIKLYEINENFLRSGWAWCYIYKKELMNKYNIRFPENNRFIDDVPVSIKALFASDTISIIGKPLYNHFENSQSITNTRPDLWKELFDAREEVLQFVLLSEHSKEFIYPFIAYYIRSMLYWLSQYFKNKKVSIKIRKLFYNKLRENFVYFDNNYDINKIKNDVNYKKFKKIIKYNFVEYSFSQKMDTIFSMKNNITPSGKHKTISLLGIKISYKIS